MGTAYLATQEIVETGALTALYQRMILETPPGGTVVSGQGTGLRVRSLRTPRVAAILSLERGLQRATKTSVPSGRELRRWLRGASSLRPEAWTGPGGCLWMSGPAWNAGNL